MPDPLNPHDKVTANRRRQLRAWIDAHFKGVQAGLLSDIKKRARGVKKEEMSQSELTGLLRDKSFGEKRARRLEKQADMPERYLEQLAASDITEHFDLALNDPVSQAGAAASPSDQWPFQRDIDWRRFDRLDDHDKGRVAQAVVNAIKEIEFCLTEARPEKRTGTK